MGILYLRDHKVPKGCQGVEAEEDPATHGQRLQGGTGRLFLEQSGVGWVGQGAQQWTQLRMKLTQRLV